MPTCPRSANLANTAMLLCISLGRSTSERAYCRGVVKASNGAPPIRKRPKDGSCDLDRRSRVQECAERRKERDLSNNGSAEEGAPQPLSGPATFQVRLHVVSVFRALNAEAVFLESKLDCTPMAVFALSWNKLLAPGIDEQLGGAKLSKPCVAWESPK